MNECRSAHQRASRRDPAGGRPPRRGQCPALRLEARGDDTLESDVDLLVDVTGETTPWFPGSLVADLEQLLGRRVQVVIRRSLSPLIRDSVLREAVPL